MARSFMTSIWRSLSTPSGSLAGSRHIAVAAALALSACGPSLTQLIRDRHYDAALCAAAFDATGLKAPKGGRALSDDLKAAIHVHQISDEELERMFAGRLRRDVRRLSQEFLFVRLVYSANEVPVGPFGLSLGVQSD